MNNNRRRDLAHDLVLPTVLFAGLGAMSWAVRGSAGAGGMNAHIAPGLLPANRRLYHRKSRLRRDLLDLDLGPDLFELLLDCGSFVLRQTFLDDLRGSVH